MRVFYWLLPEEKRLRCPHKHMSGSSYSRASVVGKKSQHDAHTALQELNKHLLCSLWVTITFKVWLCSSFTAGVCPD